MRVHIKGVVTITAIVIFISLEHFIISCFGGGS